MAKPRDTHLCASSWLSLITFLSRSTPHSQQLNVEVPCCVIGVASSTAWCMTHFWCPFFFSPTKESYLLHIQSPEVLITLWLLKENSFLGRGRTGNQKRISSKKAHTMWKQLLGVQGHCVYWNKRRIRPIIFDFFSICMLQPTRLHFIVNNMDEYLFIIGRGFLTNLVFWFLSPHLVAATQNLLLRCQTLLESIKSITKCTRTTLIVHKISNL